MTSKTPLVFQDLPYEVRQMIWEASVEPRRLHIKCVTFESDMKPYIAPPPFLHTALGKRVPPFPAGYVDSLHSFFMVPNLPQTSSCIAYILA